AVHHLRRAVRQDDQLRQPGVQPPRSRLRALRGENGRRLLRSLQGPSSKAALQRKRHLPQKAERLQSPERLEKKAYPLTTLHPSPRPSFLRREDRRKLADLSFLFSRH